MLTYTATLRELIGRPAVAALVLADGTTTQQVWLFLSAALGTYCSDELPVLSAMATTDKSD